MKNSELVIMKEEVVFKSVTRPAIVHYSTVPREPTIIEDVVSQAKDIHLIDLIAPIRFPIFEWLPEYNRDLLFKDVVAGLTVFIFLIPQGMAYALLAGMPAEYGLYSATVPLYIYAILGTSRQLSIGPMAITSLLLGVSCSSFGYEEQSSEYIRLVLSLSYLVGFITFLLGLFRLGSLSNVISQSALTGFLTASAVVIAVSQIKYIFGIHVPRYKYNVQIIARILTHLGETKWGAVLIGIASFAFLYYMREWKRKYKSPVGWKYHWLFQFLQFTANLSSFIVIVLGAGIAKLLLDAGVDIPVIGTVPSGLKTPDLSLVDGSTLTQLIPSALAIAFVAFASNWAITLKYSALNNYKVDATQELVGGGFAIMVGVIFNAFVVSGGLARTAVSAESGAVTQISSCIVATLMIIALLTATSLFYYIPMAVLAAVIEVSILSMIDFDSMVKAYRTDRRDCFVMVITFLVTFFVGVTEGLFVGVGISIAMVIKTTAFPQIVVLGKLPDENIYRDIKRYPEAEQRPGYAIIRMDASLYFANCASFRSAVEAAANGEYHPNSDEAIHTVIVDASAWVDIDLMGIQTLFELREKLGKRSPTSVNFLIACAKGIIRDRLKKCHFIESISMNNIYYASIEDAINRRRPKLSLASLNYFDLEAAQKVPLLSTKLVKVHYGEEAEVEDSDENVEKRESEIEIERTERKYYQNDGIKSKNARLLLFGSNRTNSTSDSQKSNGNSNFRNIGEQYGKSDASISNQKPKPQQFSKGQMVNVEDKLDEQDISLFL